MTTLRDIGEDPLIERLIHHTPLALGAAGPGDDCAAIDHGLDHPELELLKTDALVAGIHFLPETPARDVGWKAVARVVSDIAAMGGKPEQFLVTLAVDAATPVAWLEQLYQGIGDCLRTHNATLCGGETTRVPDGSATVISIAARGSVERTHLVLRSSGRPGDTLLVSGTLGGSITSKHLHFHPRLAEARWLVAHHKPSAMMDLSDGLAKDLPRLASASGCGARIDRSALPLTANCSVEQALTDGEDYELLMAVAPEKTAMLLDAWSIAFPSLPLTPIGHLCDPDQGESLQGGWDHFAAPSA